MAKSSLKKDLKQIERVGGRAGNDTIRLWDGFRDQALLWRSIALLQIPATALAILASLILWFHADTVVNVPPSPLPGYYSVKSLPDAEFINVSTQVINLMASYQPTTAGEQFSSVRKYLWEPALSLFEEKMIGVELGMITDTNKSQLFFIDKSLIQVDRVKSDQVVVRLPGTKMKLIGTQLLPEERWTYFVTMTTVPRNEHNPYGIVVVQIKTFQAETR